MAGVVVVVAAEQGQVVEVGAAAVDPFDGAVVYQRQPVPELFERLQKPHQPSVVVVVKPAVLHQLRQMIDRDPELVQGMVDRRQVSAGPSTYSISPW
ncbi:MAG TPA: hypothetical protein VFP89_08435 [Propionibacteriaceae bacterium]|nr:hypothetical protein [Propionibacteriaceae bacterium]